MREDRCEEIAVEFAAERAVATRDDRDRAAEAREHEREFARDDARTEDHHALRWFADVEDVVARLRELAAGNRQRPRARASRDDERVRQMLPSSPW